MEGYRIDFTYINVAGKLATGFETIYVEVTHGVNEKNNHDKAASLFLAGNPKNTKITCVTYE